MKKIGFYIILTLLSGLSASSFAVTDISFSGELDASLTWKQLPTRDQGVTAFSIPQLKLDIEAPLRDGNEVFLEFESAEYRDSNSNRMDTQLKEGYLSASSFLPPRSELRYGMIPEYYVELQREQWDYDFWGITSFVPLIKYKYSTWSDLGFMYQSELPSDLGEWALSVTNGEGYKSEEIGSRKQAQLVLNFTKAAPFYALIAYTYGNYDSYDNSFSKKTRLVTNLSYEFTNGLLALEYYATQDPADAISTGGMAAGVDVTALHATVVSGEGGSLFGRWDLSEKAALFLRADYLTPVKAERNKNLKSGTAGVSYNSNEDIRWALAYEYTDYSDDFSPSIRDESQLVLATRVNF